MPFECPCWPPDWPEIFAAAQSCLESGQWGAYHSETCSTLEKRLAERFDSAHCRLCCSGTAALEIALRAAKIGPGDEVVVAAFDYPGNFRTIELLGAKPVLIDVAKHSPCLDLDLLDSVSSENVRAVLASHLFGSPAAVGGLRDACDDRGWLLIEDACQAPGMEIEGRPAGSFGHFATLSFGGSKLISAGSGGALLVNSGPLAARLGPILDRPGETFTIGPLQAAVIGPQLDRLDEMNEIRRRTARYIEQQINSELSGWDWLSGTAPAIQSAHYKVAWSAESEQQRAQIVAAAADIGLPIGAGFRSMSRCSERRCRKPVPTPRSDELGARLFVLDHRALLAPASQHPLLADSLRQIHRTCRS